MTGYYDRDFVKKLPLSESAGLLKASTEAAHIIPFSCGSISKFDVSNLSWATSPSHTQHLIVREKQHYLGCYFSIFPWIMKPTFLWPWVYKWSDKRNNSRGWHQSRISTISNFARSHSKFLVNSLGVQIIICLGRSEYLSNQDLSQYIRHCKNKH